MKKLNLFGVFIIGTALLAGSGCHRKPNGLTPIPRMEGPSGQNNPGVMPGGTTGNGEAPVTSTPGAIPEGYGKYSDLLNGAHKEDAEKFKADTVHFDFDQATIKPEDESKLQDVAAYFKGNNTDALIVEGNCDERGTEKYNLSLGDRRALAVREYLANLGTDPQRIKTVTFGASKPVDTGHTKEAYAKNRRGDFILVTPK